MTPHFGAGPSASWSRQFLLGFCGHLDFCRANIFDFNGGGAVVIEFVAVEAYGAFDLDLVFAQYAVFEPELHRAAGIADGGAFPLPGSKGKQLFSAGLSQIAGESVTVFLEVFGARGDISGLLGRGFEASESHGNKPRRAFAVLQL